jgi:LuxR family transcriptional regulator, maltose regulon positive regulatory protein
VAAADELAQGSLRAAEGYLALAERQAPSAPEGRREQTQVLLGVVRLLVAGRSGNQPGRDEAAERLLAAAEALEAGRAGLGDELRGLALVEIGNRETWGGQHGQAASHLEQALRLARRTRRPGLAGSPG